MKRFFTIATCAFMVAACKSNSNNVVLASLSRSEKIQLFCADLTQVSGNFYDLKQVLPMEVCQGDNTFAPDVQPQFLGAVTQIQSGEVAVVSFTRSVVFDTNRTVPGVTALRVGEQPTGIQISPVESSYTYISSFSPKSVQAIPTEVLIARDQDFLVQQVRFDEGPTDLALYEKAGDVVIERNADGEVTAGAGSFEYRYLYAAIPELGQVAQIPVVKTADGKHESFDEARIRLLPFDDTPLPTYTCDSVKDFVVNPPPPTNDDYQRICPAYTGDEPDPGRYVKPVNTTVTCDEGPVPGPRPVALTIDYGLEGDDTDDVLLVADANQPVIHRFLLSREGAAVPENPADPPVLDPIISGTPTNDIAVTPFVPASSDPGDRAATERYLYAVSVTDSSVLAIDYTADPEGTAPADRKFGAVLPVAAGISRRANEENVESRNRVRSGFVNVRSIEIVAPDYKLEVDPDTNTLMVPSADICASSNSNAFAQAQNANNMRGVFLAMNLSDGTITFLDIYDLNAPCRGGSGPAACTVRETGPDRFASIRRNRRRLGFTPNTFISINGTPSIQYDTATGSLNPDTGLPANSDGPGLRLVQCPKSMFNVFNGDPLNQSEGLICASSQVWSDLTQQWQALWGGLIPNSEGGLGLFSDESFDGTPGNWFLAGDVPFCEVGVLGPQHGEVNDSELSIELLNSYGGDRLLITGELPPNTINDPNCEPFMNLKDDIDDSPVWFPIIRAFNDQLEIGPSPNPRRYTLDEIKTCFNQYTEYQIHTQDVYTVIGSVTGFVHRIVPDQVTGECILDPARPVDLDDVDTYLTGRAFEDAQFISPVVSFRIGPFNPNVSLTETTVAALNFNILNQFELQQLRTSTSQSSLPASMLFSEGQNQLYFVDFQIGVRRIIFDPLSIVQTFN